MKEQRITGREPGTFRIHKEKPSRKLTPAEMDAKPFPLPSQVKGGKVMAQSWKNNMYYGTLRRYESGSPFGGGPYAVIGIAALSEDALHDFRDFQHIKSDLVGPEWEAVELYPAESRLIDTSNFYYLWCFPPGVLHDLGLPTHERHVDGPKDMGGAQRPFPEE